MMKHLRFSPRTIIHAALLAALMSPVVAPAGEVILQYFESRWETIERRMPDVFMAGYDALWVPPPGRADQGGYSVGYDCFDRFDLGNPYSPTLYGTEQSFTVFSDEMDRAGIDLFVDTILNHNGFRDGSTPDFATYGDYPGFVVTLPNDVDGDFHGAFEGGDLNYRLAGLIDIAQEKNHVFVRHPIPGSENPIPNETPRESNRMLYPDRDLPEAHGRRPFNLADPMAGDPTPENATGLLLRYVQWMSEVHGVDGFRLDATKHIPTFFFNNFYDPTLYNLGRNAIDGSPRTPFSFGENYDGNFGFLASYVRKDGYGNRDTKDFPLFFAMSDVFNAGGFGDMRALEFASFDGWDGNANDGSYGVTFVNSHDNFGGGFFNGFNNIPHAHILTRTGFPIVYYNAEEFGMNRDFPKDGRGDALGNYGGFVLPRLVQINDQYIRGSHATRWIDADVYIYERVNQCLVGLNDRGDGGYDTRTVQTAFPGGTVLVELTGNAEDSFVDPNDDIFDSVTVEGDGRVTIRVPRNKAPVTSDFHGRGYVVYGPPSPESQITIVNSTGNIGPDPAFGRPEGSRRLATLEIVTDDTIDIELDVAGSALTPNDNSLIKVNFGELDIDGDGGRNASGEFAGFEEFPVSGRPTNAATEERQYTASIDVTGLREGYTYIETVSFLQRPGGTLPIFDTARQVVYLDRLPPDQDLLFPPRTGNGDITSREYEAVVATDHTANAVHILTNVNPAATDPEILALVSGDNMARRHDRLEYRRVLTNLTPGLLELTVVVFEESGNHSIQRYGGIDVELALPPILIGADTNPDPGAVDFQPLPPNYGTPEFPNEIVIRVQTQDIDGNGMNVAFPADFSVSLQIDVDDPIAAVPYDAALLPPVGRLVQNDQNLGDEFDEYRFYWQGYTRGTHTFRASALLASGSEPASEAIATVTVAGDTAGPSITITRPLPPGETINNPSILPVEGTFDDSMARFARVFLDAGNESLLIGTIENPAPGNFLVERAIDSYARHDRLANGSISLEPGQYTIRVVASTGPNGDGITTEETSVYTVTGMPALPEFAPAATDGSAGELLAAPALAISTADGGTGDALPADFGPDGTLTELHALVRGQTLFLGIRGDLFGADEDNFDNGTHLLMDVNHGSAQGATDIRNDLNDTGDPTREHISAAAFVLSGALESAGAGFDLVVGMSSTNGAYCYTLGTDGLPGTFTDFTYNADIAAAYDVDATAVNGAAGTTFPAPNVIEIAIPFAAIGNPDATALRMAFVSSSDGGYASPNTLPENSSDAFGADPNTQTLESLAFLPATPMVLLNEIFIGDEDLIELHNPGGAPVNLSGWGIRLYDSAGVGADYVLPPATTIAAGGYLVLTDGGGPDGKGIAPPGAITVPFNIPWDETRGGAILLIDPVGLGKDFVSWLNTGADETTATGELHYGTAFTGTVTAPLSRAAGDSLARDGSSTDTDSASDWDPANGIDATAPTFGAANSDAAGSVPSTWMIY